LREVMHTSQRFWPNTRLHSMGLWSYDVRAIPRARSPFRKSAGLS